MYARSRRILVAKRGAVVHFLRAWVCIVLLVALSDLVVHADEVFVDAARSLVSQGRLVAAEERLAEAYQRASEEPERIMIGVALADLQRRLGRYDTALAWLERSRAEASRINRADLLADVLNNLGNLHAAKGRWDAAMAAYQQSLDLLSPDMERTHRLPVLLNAGRVRLEQEQVVAAAELLAQAEGLIALLPGMKTRLPAVLEAAHLHRALHGRVNAQEGHGQAAYNGLKLAAALAERSGDLRAESLVHGMLGEWYADDQRPREALELMRRAAFLAQQAGAEDLLYRWQWRIGRLLATSGEAEAALGVYRSALENLDKVRGDLLLVMPHAAYGEILRPLFFEFTDLLLQRAAVLPDGAAKQALLQEAQASVERLKAAELQDYFEDPCVSVQRARQVPLESLPSGTAVLYPIVLPDRLEILLTLPGQIRQYTQPIAASELEASVNRYRELLEQRTTHRHLQEGTRIYRWLIAPLMNDLDRIDTLVTVPGGVLRTIPLAALYDGEHYLIDRFAVATVPGLELTASGGIDWGKPRLLLGGLSAAVQGFPGLPHVMEELNSIGELYGGARFEDQLFLLQKVEQALSRAPYSVVHIASHGQFAHDSNDTFILTYDDKLTLDRLQQMVGRSRYQDRPVELLALSACQTAAGDERAALGLAGVAVKSGARSALASLWFINDQASSMLVTDFYRHLSQPGMSKAQALRGAQRKLLEDPRYSHPGYWAPFLLIGNWQ